MKSPFAPKFLRIGVIVAASIASLHAEDEFLWVEALQPSTPGIAVQTESFQARFIFGWSGIPAGFAEVDFVADKETYNVKAKGGTTGTARALWKLDTTHSANGLIKDMRPLKFRQEERYRSYTLLTEAEFFEDGTLRRRRGRTNTDENRKWKSFPIPGCRDLLSTMLFVRSQTLKSGDEISLICFPSDSPYLVRILSEGKTTLEIDGEKKPAILLDLRMLKVETKGPDKGKTVKHSKFSNGKIWLSDDDLRLPLRCEVSLFIGYIFGQLESYSPQIQ